MLSHQPCCGESLFGLAVLAVVSLSGSNGLRPLPAPVFGIPASGILPYAVPAVIAFVGFALVSKCENAGYLSNSALSPVSGGELFALAVLAVLFVRWLGLWPFRAPVQDNPVAVTCGAYCVPQWGALAWLVSARTPGLCSTAVPVRMPVACSCLLCSVR